jgi:putative transposase
VTRCQTPDTNLARKRHKTETREAGREQAGYRRTVGRATRDEEPGGFYHVTARGSNKLPIYLDDADHLIFRSLLSRCTQRQRWIVMAWAEMENHYHLLLQIPLGGLSVGMQLLNGGYACRFNYRHDRTAHVFRNRFSSTRIESEAHLLEAARYIVLNPVRAGLCESPRDWRWSSYRACAGIDVAPPFLAESALLNLFDKRPAAARRAYRTFVAQGHVTVSDTGSNV